MSRYTSKSVSRLVVNLYGKSGKKKKRSKYNLDEAYLDSSKAIEKFNELKEQYEKELGIKFVKQDSGLNILGSNDEIQIHIFIKEYQFITNKNELLEDYVYIFTSRENVNCVVLEDLAFGNENNANNFNELTLEMFKVKARRGWEMFGYNILSVSLEYPKNDFYSDAYPGLVFVSVELEDGRKVKEYFTHIRKIPLIK